MSYCVCGLPGLLHNCLLPGALCLPRLHGFLQDRRFHPQRAWLPPQTGPPRADTCRTTHLWSRLLVALLSGTEQSGVVSALTNHRGGGQNSAFLAGVSASSPFPSFPHPHTQGINPPVLVPFSPGRLVTRVFTWRGVCGPARALWGHRVMLPRVCCTV